MDYFRAFETSARDLLPVWQFVKVHQRARARAGGHAKAANASTVAEIAATPSIGDSVQKGACKIDAVAKGALYAHSHAQADDNAKRTALASLGHGAAIRVAADTQYLRMPVRKALESPAPIFDTQPKLNIVYCVALEPDTFDFQGDMMTRDDIRDAAHAYLTDSRIIRKMHDSTIQARPVESYIAPQDLVFDRGMFGAQVVRKGSWVMGIQVRDPSVWAKIMSGEYTGISVGGSGSYTEVA